MTLRSETEWALLEASLFPRQPEYPDGHIEISLVDPTDLVLGILTHLGPEIVSLAEAVTATEPEDLDNLAKHLGSVTSPGWSQAQVSTISAIVDYLQSEASLKRAKR